MIFMLIIFIVSESYMCINEIKKASRFCEALSYFQLLFIRSVHRRLQQFQVFR